METKIAQRSGPQASAVVELLTKILARLERIDRRLDEAAGAHLNARFPYGKPVDRWKRSA